MVYTLIIDKCIDDTNIKQLEGTWIDETFIKYPIISEDTDVYYRTSEGKKLLCKFRKHVIDDELINLGWENYKNLAKASRGRGASAGPIDPSSDYWKKRNLVKTNKWATSYLNPKGNQLLELLNSYDLQEIQQYLQNHELNINTTNLSKKEIIFSIIKESNGYSKMKVNNQVASNPIGFYEESNNFSKLPCRLTHFTRTNFIKYNKGLPFIQKIDQLFKELIPDAYQKQYERANKQPLFKISKTSFSTITINRNFRTALHVDAGDFKEGFGNLTVIEKGNYSGGYTIFPQFGIGIDVRTGDFLAMDVHQYHSNSPLYETDIQKKENKKLPKEYHDNPEVGTSGIYENYTRISFVCYLREKIIHCNNTNVDKRYLTKSGHSKIDNDIYECIYDCGFCGNYPDVDKHEQVCLLAKSKD